MTNLNQEQIDALKVVETEKQKYDAQGAALKAQLVTDLATIKAPLRAAVRAARELNTPTRRIALDGMGVANVASVVALLGDAKPRAKAPKTEQAAPAKRVITSPAVHYLDDGIYIVTEPNGNEWEFWAIDLGATTLIERSDSTGRGVDSETPAPAAVIAAMKAELPRADFSALLEED